MNRHGSRGGSHSRPMNPSGGGNRPGAGSNRPQPGPNRPSPGPSRPPSGGHGNRPHPSPGPGPIRPPSGGHGPGNRPHHGNRPPYHHRPPPSQWNGGWNAGWNNWNRPYPVFINNNFQNDDLDSQLIGLTVQEARRFYPNIRVVERDGVALPTTNDFRSDRINVAVRGTNQIIVNVVGVY